MRTKTDEIANVFEIFKNKEFGNLTLLEKDNESWFIAKEIADILEYNQTSDMTRRLDTDEKINQRFQLSPTNVTQKTIINESGLYEAIFGSHMSKAKVFKKWVKTEVLPAIRKTGGYVNNDDLFINTYLPFADETSKLLFRNTLKTVRQQNEIITNQKKEIEFKEKVIDHKEKIIVKKEDIIINLVDDIDLAEIRQILNRVVRAKGNSLSDGVNYIVSLN